MLAYKRSLGLAAIPSMTCSGGCGRFAWFLRQLIAPAARNSAMRSPATPQRANALSVSAPGMGGRRERPAGVRLKRGAGAGCNMPPASVKLPRLRA